MNYPEKFNEMFNDFINNSTSSRKHFNVKINKLIQDYPDIFTHYNYSTGIKLIDDSDEIKELAKEVLLQYYHYKQPKPQPQKKFKQLTDIPELKTIIDSDDLTVSEKVNIICKLNSSNDYGITLTPLQIKQYIYRTKGTTKKESIFTQPEIKEILKDEYLTRKEKFNRIKAINKECTIEKMNNYLISKNIKSFKPYNYILNLVKNIDDFDTKINEVHKILFENDDIRLSYLTNSQKKGLLNRFKYPKTSYSFSSSSCSED